MKYTANKFNKDLKSVASEKTAGRGIPWDKYEKDMWPESFENFKGLMDSYKKLYKTEKNPYKFVEKLVDEFPGRANEVTELFGHLAWDVGPKETFNTLAGLIINVFYFKDNKIEEVITEPDLQKVITEIYKALF